MKKLITKIEPQRLFLIDAIGALISALMLGVVLTQFEAYFGMPKATLYWLAGLAGVFAVYSLTCAIRLPAKWPAFMKGIAVINWSYCVLTAVLLVVMHSAMTPLGVLYFVGEIMIVSVLGMIEFGVGRRK